MRKKIAWRGQGGDIEPVPCTYDTEFGHPHYCKTPDGTTEMMYINTHFKTKKEAWKSIVEGIRAHVILSGRHVKRIKEDLLQAEKQAAKATEQYDSIMSNESNPFRN